MTEESLRRWNWEDPQELAATVDGFTADLARCDKLELVVETPLFTRSLLAELGITGVEFAAFKTKHP